MDVEVDWDIPRHLAIPEQKPPQVVASRHKSDNLESAHALRRKTCCWCLLFATRTFCDLYEDMLVGDILFFIRFMHVCMLVCLRRFILIKSFRGLLVSI